MSFKIRYASIAAGSVFYVFTFPYAQAEHVGVTSKTLDPMVVTGTREGKLRSDVAESVDVLDSDQIERISPAHPAEALNRTAGVHVNNLGGEGHMTSIRQPITTSGVYLFLEDGLPTRPTGMFNHNGLYEINIPQADRIEITKGPGSALYGSDSIGGIINVITKAAPDEAEVSLNPEFGSFGWKRLLTSGGMPINENAGFRVDLNLTDNDGYREESEYSRYSVTGRFDGRLSEQLNSKTILSYTQVDQSGVSGLQLDDYINNTRRNFYHNEVGRREVDAFRFSTELAYEANDQDLFTLTPFVRHNRMKLMPSWMLTYDANDRDYQFQSYGFLAKYRHKLPDQQSEVIVGVDVDYTPTQYEEVRLSVDTNGDIFTGTQETGRTNYDYDADQFSISPYVHTEWQFTDRLRVTGGLRYDYFHVDYQDNLDASVAQQQFGFGGFNHLRPADQTLSFDSFSPKLGVVFDLNDLNTVYANYRHSFRVPSVGQLFRSGSTDNTAELEPVKTDSFEIGMRGLIAHWLQYDVAIYHMVVKDDIVTYIDNISNDRKVTNAGETEHQGIEFSLSADLTEEFSFRTAWTFTNQEYKDYSAVFGFPATQINFAGKDVGKAPAELGNMTLTYTPNWLPDLSVELEWEHLGPYFTDETNTQEYDGHDLLNLRANYAVTEKVEIYTRLLNLTDELYSTLTSNQVGSTDVEYRPGLPFTAFAGVRVQF